jgi:SAM-dependent methyltransferase
MSGLPDSRPNSVPPVIDYEGSGYRTDFWEGQGRNYEDATERLALQRLLPPHGRRIAEIGAGFGRLADLYLGYDQIVLVDYSRTLLHEAVARWGDDERFVFVAGNLYQLPLAQGSLDTLVMVRVMHHLADVPRALSEIYRVLHRDSTAVLEYANKRNLKAVARWLLGRQSWSPMDPAPVEFVKLNFDFHPAWMWDQLTQAHLAVRRQWAVSHFRMPLVKRLAPATWLARADGWLYAAGGRYPLAPSIFVQVHAFGQDPAPSPQLDGLADLFACPVCRGDRTLALVADDRIECRTCQTQFARRDGVWDFKEPWA